MPICGVTATDVMPIAPVGSENAIWDSDYGFDVAFPKEFQSFLSWILRDEPPLLTGEDGLRCVEILQAIEISMARGTVVRLPLPVDERGP